MPMAACVCAAFWAAGVVVCDRGHAAVASDA